LEDQLRKQKEDLEKLEILAKAEKKKREEEHSKKVLADLAAIHAEEEDLWNEDITVQREKDENERQQREAERLKKGAWRIKGKRRSGT